MPLCECLGVGFTRIRGQWAAKLEELKEKEEREKPALLETQVKELNNELGQGREKQAELGNLGVGFKRIERGWAVMFEELKDMRTELSREERS